MELKFTELTSECVKSTHVDDINRLIPQLTKKAEPLTAEWLGYILDSGTRIFVALDGEKIVGTVLLAKMVILVGQKDWIEDIIVDENYRCQGIASKLMDMAEQASCERGAKSINLTSSPEKAGARKAYAERGYALRDTGVFRKTF